MHKLIVIFVSLMLFTTGVSAESQLEMKIEKIKDDQYNLKFLRDGKIVPMSEFQEIHTQKVHLMIVDDSLSDYSHIHPKANSSNDGFTFNWRPKFQNNYKAWADIDLGKEYLVVVDFLKKKNANTKVVHVKQSVFNIMGIRIDMILPSGGLKEGQESEITVRFKGRYGLPYENLEQVMGDMAHLVAFKDDFSTIIPLHPEGPHDYVGKDGLHFKFPALKAGYYKLFLQIKVNGKEYVAPFGVVVKK